MKGVLFKRTLVLFTIVLLLAGIVLLGAYSYFGRRTFIKLELDSLDSVLHAASESYLVRDTLFSNRSNYIKSLNFMCATADVRYYFFYYNGDGTVKVYTTIADYSNEYIQTVQYDILNGETIKKDNLRLNQNTNAIAVGGPLYASSGVQEGGIIFVREIQHIDAAFTKLNSALWTLVLCTVPLIAIIGFSGIRQMNKPLAGMTTVAIELTKGNYDVRADENVPGEMGIFARAMNRMSDTLSQTIYQLDSEKRQLWSILSSFTDGVAALDDLGNLTHYNPALMRMFGAVDVQGPLDLVPDSKIWEAFQGVLETKEPRSLQYTLPGDKSLLISIVPVMAEDRCTGVVGLFKDITEIENLERTRRDYVANISHELRTPLTAIRGLLEPLSDGMVKDDATRSCYYGIMLHEVERLSRLIADMLQLSRLQSGTEYMERTVFDLVKLIDDIYQGYRQTAMQKGIRLCVETEELPEVISDADRIEQVLVILLDNAMRYAGQGGTIRIFTHQDDSDVYVSVWDSGCGIPENDIDHVFERFFKSDKSRKEGGTGLGLSIAKEIMDKLGESIGVKSKVGEWTCFTFTVKKYISNAIQLGPVDMSRAIIYDSGKDTAPHSNLPEESSGKDNTAMDAPYEVISDEPVSQKNRGEGKPKTDRKNKKKNGGINLF